MKAKFIGDPNDGFSGPASIEVGGQAFAKDQWAPVSDALGAKLKGHSHFEVGEDEAQQGGDGADEDAEKAEIRAELAALGAEKPHHATGLERLRLLLAEARAAALKAQTE